jgi:nucleoside-diphosphate-sugar epimerase
MHFDGDLIVIAITALTTVGMVTLGPIGRAVAERLRGKHGADSVAGVQDQLDEVIGRLDQVQRQLGDLAERQDFSERLLAQAKDRGLLAAPAAPGPGRQEG